MRKERQEDIVQRLRCAEGHARGVARMVESGADCLAVVRQVKAVQGALDKVAQLILQEHLMNCLPSSLVNEDQDTKDQALVEFANLLRLARTN